MARINYLVTLAVLVLCTTFSSEAQVLKNGLCPSTQQSVFGYQHSAFDFRTDQVDPFLNRSTSLPQYSPVLLNATSLGIGTVGAIPLGGNYMLRISMLDIFPNLNPASLNLQGFLMPIELGLRVPFINSTLGSLGYTLYGETSAGLMLGMIFPTNGSFLSYSLPNSRFSTGASAYAGIGNTLRMDRYVGLYLNGGVGYFDMFSSTFLPRTNYFYPSVSVGFYFNIGR